MPSDPCFRTVMPFVSERIDIKIPSRVSLVEPTVRMLMDRMIDFRLSETHETLVATALHEAIGNAMKHGNHFDEAKWVKVSVKLSPRRAVFSIEDEGEGFDPAGVNDPTAEDALLRESGRGILLMRHLMDEVRFNKTGNRITLVKKAEKSQNHAGLK
ncbi:MAG: ATP-binding protein [Acidobacteria bacterium]|nr:ATP-binding protein [Acidobacteriota bacterium]